MGFKTDRQSVVLDGFRYFSCPKDGGGTNDDLARPLQHPLLPGHLEKMSHSRDDVFTSLIPMENASIIVQFTVTLFFTFYNQHFSKDRWLAYYKAST